VVSSLTFLFYKSHAWPRFAAVPSFARPAWQFGPAIKLCSMDVRLFLWAFFVSGVFPNIWCHDSDQGALPALTLLSWPPPPHPSLSLFQLPFRSSGIWAALPAPLVLENATNSLAHREVPQHPLPSTTCQSSLKVLSQWVLLACKAVISLVPQNPSARSQLILIPGNQVPH
jgi:hypothetical protein